MALSFRSMWNSIVSKLGGKGSSVAKQSSSSSVLSFDPFSGSFGSRDADKALNATYVSCIQAYEKAICKIKPHLFYKGKPSADPMDYILGTKPNKAQNAVNFWKQVAKSYFEDNVAVIWIQWDYSNKRALAALYAIDLEDSQFKMMEDSGSIYFQFTIEGKTRVVSSDDLIILTYDPSMDNPYVTHSKALTSIINIIDSDFTGLNKSLQMGNIIRFVAQSGTTLKPSDLALRQKNFNDIIRSVDSGGVLYIDNAQTLTTVNTQSKWASPDDIKEFRRQILQYFQVPESVLDGSATDDVYQSWVESSIEPITLEIEAELNSKLLTSTERGFGNEFRIDSNALFTASLAHRIALADELVKSAGYYYNEVRDILGLPLLEDSENKFIERTDRVDSSSSSNADAASADTAKGGSDNGSN